MNDLNKTLSDVFDIAPIPEEKKEKLPTVSVKYNEPDLKQDLTDAYQQSKKIYKVLLTKDKKPWKKYSTLPKQANIHEHLKSMVVY